MTPRKRFWEGKKLIIVLVLIMLAAVGVIVLARLLRAKRSPGSIPDTLDPHMTYEVVNTYPHDPVAFTQGLIYHQGYLYESTGLYGESSLRQVDLETGAILQYLELPPDFFGEGLTHWEETLLQLTWQEGTGFIYNLADFSLLGQFNYLTEGWGLTQDGARLIFSDGSHQLFFLDPDSFQVLDSVAVTDGGAPIERLNELEFIRGEVYANVWLTDDIVRIDPATGTVTGWIDLAGILPAEMRGPETDVLNGIAYDPEGNRLFVTGKKWPTLYEIRLVPVDAGD